MPQAVASEITGLREVNDVLRMRVAELEAKTHRQQAQAQEIVARLMSEQVELRLALARYVNADAEAADRRVEALREKKAAQTTGKG
jgi:hypothetical protein